MSAVTTASESLPTAPSELAADHLRNHLIFVANHAAAHVIGHTSGSVDRKKRLALDGPRRCLPCSQETNVHVTWV
jgi:hypothetical protein